MRESKHCVVFYMTPESAAMGVPSVVGPFDDIDEAIEHAQKLIQNEYHWVKLAGIYLPEKEHEDGVNKLRELVVTPHAAGG
jgi:hypothetical protein